MEKITVDLRGKKFWVFFFFLDDKQIVVWLKDLYCKAAVNAFVENIWEVRKEDSKLGINLFFPGFSSPKLFLVHFLSGWIKKE